MFEDYQKWGEFDPFEEQSGPYYFREVAPGRYECAFLARESNMNASGVMHGGALMTFADFAMFVFARDALAQCDGGVTISFSSEFLAASYPGDIIKARGETVRETGSLAFMRGEVFTEREAGDEILLTFSGVIKKLKKRGEQKQSTEDKSVVVGVDGCSSGWIAVSLGSQSGPAVSVFSTVQEIIEAYPGIVAIDMPIGFPDTISGPGREAEKAVRPLLGGRQSSVFSMPARSAVEAPSYAEACAAAFSTSSPQRKISKQAFMLFPKILEIDRLLRADPSLLSRVYETHPEVCFWRLNGERSLEHPKKIKSRPNPEGLAERRTLLRPHGFTEDFLTQKIKGVGADDLLDAAACAVIAQRIAKGEAEPFPNPPGRDAHGIPIAIWA